MPGSESVTPALLLCSWLRLLAGSILWSPIEVGLAGARPLTPICRGASTGLGGGGGPVAAGPFGLAEVEELAGVEWLGGRLHLFGGRVPLGFGGFQELEAEEAGEFVIAAGGGLGGPGGRAACPGPPGEEFALQRDDLLQLHDVIGGQQRAGPLGLVGAVGRGPPGALPFALALLVGRVLPGCLGLGLVAVGLALLARLVLGVPLPLLLLPLAPLLLLEVVLGLALVLLPAGARRDGDTMGMARVSPSPPVTPTLKASRRWYSSLAISSATHAGMSGMATWMTYFSSRAKCCRDTGGTLSTPMPPPQMGDSALAPPYLQHHH